MKLYFNPFINCVKKRNEVDNDLFKKGRDKMTRIDSNSDYKSIKL